MLKSPKHPTNIASAIRYLTEFHQFDNKQLFFILDYLSFMKFSVHK